MQHLHCLREGLLTNLAKDQTQYDAGHGVPGATQEEARNTCDKHHHHINGQTAHGVGTNSS